METKEERYLRLSIAARSCDLPEKLTQLLKSVKEVSCNPYFTAPERTIESMKNNFLSELDLFFLEVAQERNIHRSKSGEILSPMTAREVSERFP